MDGIAYTWDANGNLLEDGVSTYTYDHANRLTSVVQGSDTSTFTYNGLSDRLGQTVNGIPTNYTLDLNVGLTQVLDDGTNDYLYGLGRIGEEQPEGWQYHLADALGSVRQLADTSSTVALGQGYDPFGSVLTSLGTASSAFQFAGEQYDSNGLMYLRARYYSPGTGRFIGRDLWAGDMYRPASFNAWLYALGNPVNILDPSGLYGSEVHYGLTRQSVLKYRWIVNIISPLEFPDQLDEHIADANEYVDRPGGALSSVACRECHFSPLQATMRHVEKAIETGNAFMFGASLHQLQDWFSHWHEGYDGSGLGHAPHSVIEKTRTWIQRQDFFWG